MKNNIRLFIRLSTCDMTPEVNTIIRGHVFPPRIMDIAKSVAAEFQKFVAMTVVSHAELFGGKAQGQQKTQVARDFGISRETLYQYFRLSES